MTTHESQQFWTFERVLLVVGIILTLVGVVWLQSWAARSIPLSYAFILGYSLFRERVNWQVRRQPTDAAHETRSLSTIGLVLLAGTGVVAFVGFISISGGPVRALLLALTIVSAYALLKEITDQRRRRRERR